MEPFHGKKDDGGETYVFQTGARGIGLAQLAREGVTRDKINSLKEASDKGMSRFDNAWVDGLSCVNKGTMTEARSGLIFEPPEEDVLDATQATLKVVDKTKLLQCRSRVVVRPGVREFDSSPRESGTIGMHRGATLWDHVAAMAWPQPEPPSALVVEKRRRVLVRLA